MTEQSILVYEPSVELPESAAAYLNELKVVEFQLSIKQPMREQRRLLESHRSSLRRIMGAFEAGFEPTTPNQRWYYGGVGRNADHKTSPFPSEPMGPDASSRFKGLMPVAVQTAYLRAVPVFGNEIVVYSPEPRDFKMTRPIALVKDPIMVAYLRRDTNVGGGVFFEVARWDMLRDLEALKGLLPGKRGRAHEADEVYDPPETGRISSLSGRHYTR